MTIPEEDKPYLRGVTGYILNDLLVLKKLEHDLVKLSLSHAQKEIAPAELFVQRRAILKRMGMLPVLPYYHDQHTKPDGLTLLLYLRAHEKDAATNLEVNRWAWKLWKEHNRKERTNEKD